MKRIWVLGTFLVMAISVVLAGCSTTGKKSGGLIGNSYASQMKQVDDTTLRITTRKKVSGDLEEVSKPGTSTYKAFIDVQNGATARAAMEAKNLGFDVYQVLSLRNYQVEGGNKPAEVREMRSASADMGNGLSESAYTFAQGHYSDSVELSIEMTVKLIPGKMPANPPKDYVDVNEVLTQIGMAHMFVDQEETTPVPKVD